LRLDDCTVSALSFLLTILLLMRRSDAARLGYDVIIAEDAVGDRDIPGASGADVTKMVMAELGDAFGTIVKGSDIK
jgi:hypothetical protein